MHEIWHGTVALSNPGAAAPTRTVVTPEGMYADVAAVSNIVIGFEAIEVTGAPTLVFETALVPTATGDWIQAVPIAAATIPIVPGMIGVEIDWDSPPGPPPGNARLRAWLRWKIEVGSDEAVTFRTFVLSKQGG